MIDTFIWLNTGVLRPEMDFHSLFKSSQLFLPIPLQHMLVKDNVAAWQQSTMKEKKMCGCLFDFFSLFCPYLLLETPELLTEVVINFHQLLHLGL